MSLAVEPRLLDPVELGVDDLRDLQERIGEVTDPADMRALIAELDYRTKAWIPRPHQIPPPGDWYLWVLLGGRGSGKSDGAAHDFYEHMMGPPCDPRIPGGHYGGIIAPTIGDAARSCINSPSGLRAIDPRIKTHSVVGGTIVRFPNGAEAMLFGAHTKDDPERLRSGGNRCRDWWEELAAWRYLGDTYTQAQFGLRLGRRPHAVASTTPKNRPTIIELMRLVKAEPDRYVMTSGTTADNPHLPAHIRRMLYRQYLGTRIGRQELLGQILTDLGTRLSGAWYKHIDSPPSGPGWERIRYWDLAATEGDESEFGRTRSPDTTAEGDPDWTAGARLAFHREKRLLVVEHMIHIRRSGARVQEAMLRTALADGKDVTVVIEQDPGQAGKDQIRRYKEALASTARVEHNPVSGAGKLDIRAQNFETIAEQRRVAVIPGPWLQAFVDESEEWGSEDARHDDQIAAVAGGTNWLMGGRKRRTRVAA